MCVELVTIANDGFNLAGRGVPESGVIVLEPAASVSVRYRFQW